MKKVFVLLPLLLALCFPAYGQQCRMNKDVKPNIDATAYKACLNEATVILDQPQLTLADVKAGPTSVKSFQGGEDVTCSFKAHYTFKSDKGKSPKFRCYRLENGAYFNEEGKLLTQAKSVGADDVLLDGMQKPLLNAAGKPEKADEVKVKYFTGSVDKINERHREPFVELAVTRIFWVLGFPVDRMYPTNSIRCLGCSDDPFGDDQDKPLSLSQSALFPLASIERMYEGKTLEVKIDESWDFGDVTSFYKNWSLDKKQQYEAFHLLLSVVHYHNAMSKQNRLVCAKGALDKTTGVCSKPVIFVQDLGSTFGNKNAGGGSNPRGDFLVWKDTTVFSDKKSCKLANGISGPGAISEEGRKLLANRLLQLTPDKLRAIFEISRFHVMDPDLRKLIAKQEKLSGYALDNRIIDLWVNEFSERVAEIQSAVCH